MTTYKIYRYFENGRKRLIYRRVSKEFAKIWCNSKDSKGVTRKGVHWFDGFTEGKPTAKQESRNTGTPI